MIQFKSDGRYKYHDRGLHYIAEFRWASLEERMLFTKLIKVMVDTYGPEKEKQMSEHGYTTWKLNENWRCEQNRSAKRRRIYLREESALTMALLRV
jgi:hypothetical protein